MVDMTHYDISQNHDYRQLCCTVRPCLYSSLLFLSILVLTMMFSGIVFAADDIVAAKLDNTERVKRLQDITINTEDWFMSMPTLQSGISKSGLQTAGYSALQKDMLDVMYELSSNPQNTMALNKLEIIRDRVENRVLANLDAGYLYAASIYLGMLKDIDPKSPKILEYQQQVDDKKAFRDLSEKFQAALDDNRVFAPEGDCASEFLQQMQALKYVDVDKLDEAISKLDARRQVAQNS